MTDERALADDAALFMATGGPGLLVAPLCKALSRRLARHCRRLSRVSSKRRFIVGVDFLTLNAKRMVAAQAEDETRA